MKYIHLTLISVLFFTGLCLTIPCSAYADNSEQDYQNLELFTDVLSMIRKSYVEETDSKELMYGAIKGMLETLDPHSSFLTPEMYQEMQDETAGEYGGLGIEITIKDGFLLIVSPIEDSPAFKAGIKAGDRIVQIDERSTTEMETMEAVHLLRGAVGEAVTLHILREGFSEPRPYTIVRDTIQLHSVKSRLIAAGYGYVRLLQFQERTAEDLKQQLNTLRKENGAQLNGLILDLRNNPGGLLDQAVAVSDLFLSAGLIVYTEGREPGSVMRFQAQAEGTEADYPIVVLINGGSASASEIVAGALHDQKRALIMGEQSFGKGSVQSVIPMGDDSGLRLTTARYFTPNGTSIQARGITPDIVVTQQQVTASDDETIREQDLENHFQPQQSLSDKMESAVAQPIKEEQQNDQQLMRALELLRGVDILRAHRPAA